MEWKYLFRPLTIGPITVKNRLGFAPNCPVTDGDLVSGLFGEDSVYYYAERAKGGQGLIIIGNTRVSKRTPYYPLSDPQLFNDGNIPWLQKIAREVHQYEAKLFIQLFYTSWARTMQPQQSAQYHDEEVDLTVPAPSTISNAALGVHLRAMSIEEIEQASEEFAQAALRAVEGGVDGVEISAHHLMLHAQFLNPVYNRRTDRYGGSMENRARFLIETLQRVRAAIGNQVVMGYRINSHWESPAEISVSEVQEIIRYVNSHTKVDYVSVSQGGGPSHSMIAPMGFKAPGYQMPYTARIKEVCSMPVFGIGSITSPYHAEDALAKGQCDLVLMARQLFADPEFANKALEGRPDDIRPCVRYNFCASRAPFRPGCFQNVTHGREKIWGIGTIQKVTQPKGVIVIGGGPAGLEAARVAAERGHFVALYEKEAQLGGRLRLQARLPLQHEFGNLIAWYEHRLRKLQVPVHLGKEVTKSNLASVLDQQDPDAVVVATGSRSAPTGFVGIVGGAIPGSDTRMALSYEDVVTGKAQVGHKVVIFDNFSNELAVGLALLLASRRHEVLLVTPYNDVAIDQYTNRTLRSVHMEEVANHKSIKLLPHTYVKRIGERTVTLADTFSSREWVEEGVDNVVPLVHFEPHNELYSEIKGKVKETYIIGDALSYRHVHDAILEGHRVGRKL